MKELLRFNYQDKELILILEDGIFKFLKIEDGIISFDVKKEEENIIKDVFESIIPSANVYYLGRLNYKGKSFSHFMDNKSFMHLFYEINHNKLIEPSENEIAYFNNLFNGQEEYVSEHFEKISNKPFFKRLVKLGSSVIVVFVSSTILFVPSTLCVDVKKSDSLVTNMEWKEDIYFDDCKNGLSVLDLIGAINNNDNLSREEKTFLLSSPKYFEDNLAFFNKDVVLNTLGSLKIIYNSDSCYSDYSHTNLGGTFGRVYNDQGFEAIIETFNVQGFNEVNKSVVSHEFCHSFSEYEKCKIGRGIHEALNVIFNDEYFGEVHKDNNSERYDTGYAEIKDYVYALCEIIDNPDLFRKYHVDPDYRYIIEELQKIIPDEIEAFKLIVMIDMVNKIDKTDGNWQDYYKRLDEEIRSILTNYYEVKYQRSIKDNDIMLYYLDKDSLKKNIVNYLDLPDIAIDYMNIYATYYKEYFNCNMDRENTIYVSTFSKIRNEYKYYQAQDLKEYNEQQLESMGYELMNDGNYRRMTRSFTDYIDYPLSPGFKYKINR